MYVQVPPPFFGHLHAMRTPRDPEALKIELLAARTGTGYCDCEAFGRLRNGFSHASQREAPASFSSVQCGQTCLADEGSSAFMAIPPSTSTNYNVLRPSVEVW